MLETNVKTMTNLEDTVKDSDDSGYEIEKLRKELRESQETIDNLLNDVQSWQVKYEKANKTIERLKACANVREFTDSILEFRTISFLNLMLEKSEFFVLYLIDHLPIVR